MAHGLGAVKEMYLEFFARRFAEAGIAALLFDYRYFGASGGEPRQRVSPHDQIEDYRSALTCLSLLPEVDADRLGVWGTSFSGGHVLHVAAYDPRVKVVVSQVGAMDVNEILRTTAPPGLYATLQQMTVQERIRRATEAGRSTSRTPCPRARASRSNPTRRATSSPTRPRRRSHRHGGTKSP